MVFGQGIVKKLGDSMKIAFDPSSGPILVTGGDGVVAYRVACRLLATGYPTVRVGVKDVSVLANLEESGAEVVTFDWEDMSTYEPALTGIRSVFISMPHTPKWDEQFSSFLELARSLGCGHFVKLSFSHALTSQADTMTNFVNATRKDDPFLRVPLVRMHRECDGKLIKMSLPSSYTILFASHFMSNPAVYQKESILKEHKFYGASAGHGVNYVSPNDCAEVAVRALLAPKEHHRVGYKLTGPSAMKDTEVADLLGQAWATQVSYVDKPLEEYAQENAKDTDWGPAKDVACLEYVKASGIEQKKFVSQDINKICGHPAETFEEYLNHVDFMTPRELPLLSNAPTVSQVVNVDA